MSGDERDSPFTILLGVGGGLGSDEARDRASEPLNELREAFQVSEDSLIPFRPTNVGRGGDAVALLFDVGALIASYVAGGVLLRGIREATDEYNRWIGASVDGIRRFRRAFDAWLERRDTKPDVSVDIAALLALADVANETGAVPHLVWWDESVIDPMEWNLPASRLDASPERLYFFVIDAEQTRWFIAMKATTTILARTRVWLPPEWMHYGFSESESREIHKGGEDLQA